MGSDMFFLLRTAFWLTLVLALIPLGSNYESNSAEDVNPVSAFIAAQATVSDIGGFCQRNPLACETGGNALTTIGNRASNGVRVVYEYIGAQVAANPEKPQLVTGSTVPAQSNQPLQNFSGASSWQPDAKNVSQLETALGPFPRPKPRSGQKT
jgi:Family of unknown function (DUF5330)